MNFIKGDDMATSTWSFDGNFIVSDTGERINISDLLIRGADGSVKDIYGNPISHSVINADKLGGMSASEFITVANISKSSIPEFKTLYSSIALKNVINISNATLVGFTGLWNSNIKLPSTGSELLDNNTLLSNNNIYFDTKYSISVGVGNLNISSVDNDSPNAEMLVTLTAGKKYYLTLKISGIAGNVIVYNQELGISTPNITMSNISGSNNFVLHVTKSGIHRIRFTRHGTTGTTVISNLSIKETSLVTNKGDYYTTIDAVSTYTVVNTGITSKSIHYNPNTKYSNTVGNNIVFLKDSFSILEYISNTPNLIGYIKDNNNVFLNFFNKNSLHVGDFNSIDDLAYYSYTQYNSSVTFNNPSITYKRISNQLDSSFSYSNTVIPNSDMLFTIFIHDISGDNWYIKINDTEYPIVNTGNTNIDNDRLIRIYHKATGSNINFSIISKDYNDTSYITIGELNGYTLDSTVWKDVTPISNNDKTSTYLHHNTESTFTSITNSTTGTTGRICKISTLFENEVLDITNSMFTREHSEYEYMNNEIKLRDKTILNSKNVKYSLLTRTYPYFYMYKSGNGKKSLIAYNPFTSACIILTEGNTTIASITIPNGSKINSIESIILRNNECLLTKYIDSNIVSNNYAFNKDVSGKQICIDIKSDSIVVPENTTKNNQYLSLYSIEECNINTYMGGIPKMLPINGNILSLTIVPVTDGDKIQLDSIFGFNLYIKINNECHLDFENNIFINTDNNQVLIRPNDITNKLDIRYICIIQYEKTGSVSVDNIITGSSTFIISKYDQDSVVTGIKGILPSSLLESITKYNIR